ncbi:MAG: hypothetical protein IH591_06385 [Bacteroidales bacterium]|nr:hypothetical protein [Bacteroidales bacterium]
MNKLLMILAATIELMSRNVKETAEPGYDAELAASLGADDYGMKMYTLVMLKTGPSQESDKTVLDSLFRGHLNNISKLAEEGKLVVAGPLAENDKDYRGIFILAATSKDEVDILMADDPAIASGVLAVEYYDWYGSAALSQYLEVHKQIEKVKP